MNSTFKWALVFLIGTSSILTGLLSLSYMELTPRIGTGPKKVAAFYYGWYSNSTNYTQSSPFSIVDDTTTRHFPDIFNTPLQGEFDSADPSLIEQHLRWAEWAGIDALICSYWGKNGYEWYNFQNMLRVAKYINSNLTFSVYFEIFMGGLDKKTSSEQSTIMIDEFRTIFELFNSTEFRDLIWVENEVPVLFVYVTQAVSATAWETTIHTLAEEDIQFFICADRPGNGATMNNLFQANHQYDVYYPTYHNTFYSTFTDLKWNAIKYNQLFAAGVTPGYDDHVVRPGNPPISRDAGTTYTASWERAISLNPDWILITSWNEWHEGTEIEPSVENADLALNQTKTYAAEFKSGIYEELHPQFYYWEMIQTPFLVILSAWGAFFLLYIMDRINQFHLFMIFLGLLMVLIAWAGIIFTIVYEVGLGFRFVIIGQPWGYILPALVALHVGGIKIIITYHKKRKRDHNDPQAPTS
jgi:hypothetical protein